LKDANATKDKFFSIISHDLKNPFSTMLGYADLLTEQYDNIDEEERRKYIGSIKKSAKHTFNLLENLLSWSRAQRGEIQIQKKELFAGELVDKTLKVLSETAKNKNIIIEKEISPQLILNADEETISTVIRNLVTNAIKFTQSNGHIKVSAFDDKNKIYISIEDNGIGISQEDLALLFRIDRQYTTEGTAHERGTGLGLILCKEFMKKNDGDILVESKFGKGSKFTISLPK
jgi:signal transduction histidine kinase